MENTENLALPYIMPSQAQKHVTHNEALRMLDAIVQLSVLDKDLDAPPPEPEPGARYIVGADPTGVWSGHEDDVAAWQDGAWTFYRPSAGWTAWVDDESRFYLFSGGGWSAAPANASLAPRGAWSDAQTYQVGDLVEHQGHAFLSNVGDNLGNEPDGATPGSTAEWTHFAVASGGGAAAGGDGEFDTIGINEDAGDAVNRLRVASRASLFDHEDGVGHQIKVNKQSSGDTCSVLFQTGYVGHAEFGLAGDDDWHVKVSPDGDIWHEALVVNRATGAVSMPNTPGGGGRELLSADRTYYVRADGSDANDGLTDNAGGAFLTVQKAVDVVASAIDAAGFTVTVQIGDGTYTDPVVLKNVVGFGGAGTMVIRGNNGAPANVTISTTGVSAFSATGLYTVWDVLDLRVQTASSGSCMEIRHASMRFGNVVFGAGFLAHVYLLDASATALSNYAVSGGASRHVICHNNSFFDSANRTVTYSGSPVFGSRNYECRYNSVCFLYGMTFGGGGVTGQRFFVADGSVIHTNGGGASYLPGNAAGSGTNFGASPWGLYQ